MKELVERLVRLEKDIAAEKGTFDLFALFLREDAQDKWDLVASAAWLDKNEKEGLAYLADRLRSSLSADELLSVSRIVVVDQRNPALEAIHQAIRIEHDVAEVKESNFFGLDIKHAYIITSKKQSETVSTEVG